MKIPELIQGLQEFLRMEELEADADGVYTVVFDDGLAVEMLALTDKQLLLRSRLDDVPDDKEQHETFFREFLQHNLLGLREQNCSLSLDQEQGCVWLHRLLRVDRLEVRRFCELVEDFVNSIEWWRQFESDPQPAPGGMMPFNMMRP